MTTDLNFYLEDLESMEEMSTNEDYDNDKMDKDYVPEHKQSKMKKIRLRYDKKMKKSSLWKRRGIMKYDTKRSKIMKKKKKKKIDVWNLNKEDIRDLNCAYALLRMFYDSIMQPVCANCGITQTVMWRRGWQFEWHPEEQVVLCNACGLRFYRSILKENSEFLQLFVK